MKTLILICFVCGILNVYANETNKPNKIATNKQIADDTTAASSSSASGAASVMATSSVAKESPANDAATKDKRQTKETKDAGNNNDAYANHRSDSITSGNSRSSANSDDPEDPQETIYGTDGRQFLIRPQQQQHSSQQSDEEQQEQSSQIQHHQPVVVGQLRNYPVTIRPHSSQLLEQSQEIQHYAYLQDLNRHQQKLPNQGKSRASHHKKSATRRQPTESQSNTQVEEAEQRYAVAVEQPVPQHLPRAHIYRPQIPYHIALQQQHLQTQAGGEQANQPQQQYQVIPEEQFLKLLEQELQARAYQEDQARRQQAQAQSQKATSQSQGLGHYRQRIESGDELQQQPDYVQYQVPRSRGGPKYLPLPQNIAHEQQQAALAEHEASVASPPPSLPPQIAYYQPQINYKTLANHPLAKSSLEKEIENLLASNKPHVAQVQIVDNSNEPSVLINHHHHRQTGPTPQPHPSRATPKAYLPTTAAPNSLADTNNRPFIPSALFRFSSYQQPTANYPSQSLPQHVVDAKKLGPVVYPQQPQNPTAQPPVQASQFYYQETPLPSPRPKAIRHKYGTKFSTTPSPLKTHQNDVNYPTPSKYAHPILYDIERPTAATAPSAPGDTSHFYPSPPDPHRNTPAPPTVAPTPAATSKYAQQYPLPVSSPSQSTIYVSQGTGIATPSRPVSTIKPKTIEDLKQLHLPQPGGKPLTQAEFQALVDAGYPVTAVPVPIPVPYEQYVKDHPEYRNQPPPQPPALPVNYEQLMRFAQLQQHQAPHHQYIPQRAASHPHHHPRNFIGRPSEPSVKIISSPSEPQQQTVSALGGGSVTYLRAIPENSKRRPRDESETEVLGAKEEQKNPVQDKQLDRNDNADEVAVN
ncbi:uncharacterized protein LOC142234195 [Haematobia irritans]|uniref:uncharacterized protein LOC142234195 n=1 Tax=Haematobia irritans TaxID=7368 RepID=UPI003F501816